jgi:mannose-1-phosphate guanylyltransferase
LRPLSCSRPKTLFPIVNKPLLEWIFQRLSSDGITEAVMATNALTQFYIRQQKPAKHGLKVRFSVDPPRKPLGTAGPIKKAEKLITHEEPFIVLNGDIFVDLSYRELIEAHARTGALATIALTKVEDPCRYGVAELSGNKIKRFIEKPTRDNAPSNLINAGVYVLSPEVFDYIAPGKHVSIEREVFPKLAEEGKLCGHCIDGLWIDIGKPEEFLQTNKLILDIEAKKIKPFKAKNFQLALPVAIDSGVSIGEGSTIGPYAILGKNVVVGKNVHISNSVVFAYAEIGENAQLDGALVGEGAKIGGHVKLNSGCIVGDNAKIKDNLTISNGSSVCPAKEITENV